MPRFARIELLLVAVSVVASVAANAGDAVSASIFISIASFRDPLCARTILGALRAAQEPSRLMFGVVDQSYLADVPCFPSECSMLEQHNQELCRRHKHQVLVGVMDPKNAKGPTHARHLAEQLWSGQDFVLQIDAHMQFAVGWDVSVVNQWLATNNEMAILTSYPTSFDGSLNPKTGSSTLTTTPVMCGMNHDDGVLRLDIAKEMEVATLKERGYEGEPMLHVGWAAGLSFSKAHKVQRVPYDRHTPMLFMGEEVAMLARCWTHGYDFYSFSQNIIFHVYPADRHLLGVSAVPHFDKDPDRDAAGRQELNTHAAASKRRVRLLVGVDDKLGMTRTGTAEYSKYWGKYGLGSVRLLSRLWKLFDIDHEAGAGRPLCEYVWSGRFHHLFVGSLNRTTGIDYDAFYEHFTLAVSGGAQASDAHTYLGRPWWRSIDELLADSGLTDSELRGRMHAHKALRRLEAARSHTTPPRAVKTLPQPSPPRTRQPKASKTPPKRPRPKKPKPQASKPHKPQPQASKPHEPQPYAELDAKILENSLRISSAARTKRLKKEEETRMQAVQEAAADAARIKAAEVAARIKAAGIKAARVKAAAEAARVKAARKKAAEDASMRAAEEEAARVKAAAEEEAARVKAAEVAVRIKAARMKAARVKAAAEEEAAEEEAAEVAVRIKAAGIKAARVKAAAEAARVKAARKKAAEDASMKTQPQASKPRTTQPASRPHTKPPQASRPNKSQPQASRPHNAPARVRKGSDASVQVMITHHMRKQLSYLGYLDSEIASLAPERASVIIGHKIRRTSKGIPSQWQQAKQQQQPEQLSMTQQQQQRRQQQRRQPEQLSMKQQQQLRQQQRRLEKTPQASRLEKTPQASRLEKTPQASRLEKTPQASRPLVPQAPQRWQQAKQQQQQQPEQLSMKQQQHLRQQQRRLEKERSKQQQQVRQQQPTQPWRDQHQQVRTQQHNYKPPQVHIKPKVQKAHQRRTKTYADRYRCTHHNCDEL